MVIKKEIDLVKLEKELNKQQYMEYMSHNYKNKLLTLAELGLFISGNAYKLSQNSHEMSHHYPISEILIISPIIIYFMNKLELKKIKRQISEVTTHEIKELIKESDEYKELNEEYKNYIFSLANFMKSQGITDGPKVAFLYQHMLNLGYLSYPKSHKYNHSLSNKEIMRNAHKYEIADLWGARVITGSSVCRHMSSLLTDLENEIGNCAYTLKVFSVDKNISSYQYSDYIASHCISAIHDKDNNIFGYCPTNNLALSLNTTSKYNYLLFNTYLSCSPVLYDGPCNNIFVAKDIENYNDLYDNSDINKILSLDGFNNYATEHLRKSKAYVDDYIHMDSSVDELENFYLSNLSNLKRINNSLDYLMPLTENKVKKLIIRK